MSLAIRKSIFFQLSVAYFLLTIFGAIVYSTLLRSAWETANDLALQRSNWHLATDLSVPITEAAARGENDDVIKQMLWRIQEVHPDAEPAVIDLSGKIIVALNRPNDSLARIDVTPLAKFTELETPPLEPIYGERTTAYQRGLKVFSAAKIVFREKPAYFYIRLNAGRLDTMRRSLRTSNILNAGIRSLLLAGICTLGLGVLVIFLLTRRFSRMTTVIRKFTDGDFKIRAEDPNDDEIGTHAAAFNQMADAIEGNIALLEKNDAMRRKLFAHVSHELNRPITVVESSLEVLQAYGEKLSEAERKKVLAQSIESVHSLGVLVRDIFELSKLEANDSRANFGKIDVKDLLNEALQKAQLEATKKDIKLTFEGEEHGSIVNADPRLIDRLVSNLVENAIRYSDPGTEITVRLTTGSERVRVEVSDQGIGIAKEDLDSIFDSFFRTDEAMTHCNDGSGLGLAISKKIAEIHGSTLLVSSVYGQGSRFEFSLPLA